MAVARSTDSEIDAALAELPGWERDGDALHRTYTRSGFADAIAFVVRIGFAAEAANHHPDLDLRWRTVRVVVSTHECGGISARDFALAAQIDAIAAIDAAAD
jgi:4a-hydroxytetrahydrobiopterin dehydratase